MIKIPVSVLIVTKNEARNMERCLNALKDFDDVIVIDSKSNDETVSIAKNHNVQIINFEWNGQYPKKRQWCLDTLNLKHDFVFWVDADEGVPRALIKEIGNLDFKKAGYFVKGANVVDGKVLKFGLKNNKLALFNRHKIEFPVVDDLDIDGMGEIEGHYQPVLKEGHKDEAIGQLKTPLHHYAFEDHQRWQERHIRYAKWERAMIKRGAYPKDPIKWRESLKALFRHMPLKSILFFIYIYLIKLGFLDRRAGYIYSRAKANYYKIINKA